MKDIKSILLIILISIVNMVHSQQSNELIVTKGAAPIIEQCETMGYSLKKSNAVQKDAYAALHYDQGNYVLEIRITTSESRPAALNINGKTIAPISVLSTTSAPHFTSLKYSLNISETFLNTEFSYDGQKYASEDMALYITNSIAIIKKRVSGK